jgi:predicted DsbA family dithiol-disulfide isomerase|eukprot:COSAG06_NODE_582_length_14006_cov_13.658661_5_plen_193_part_00
MAAVQREPLVAGAPMAFTVLRVPFFLEPDYSTGEEFEETNRVRLIRKWGGQAGWEEQKRRHGLKERGREVGIQHFNLDRIASSTVASHRLVQWVTKTLGVNKAEEMYAELNSRHFEDGQKLNDKGMLTSVAANVGADPDEARRFLDSDQGLSEIRAAQRQLRDLGVSGIPTLILGGKWQLPSGAIGSEMLVQ